MNNEYVGYKMEKEYRVSKLRVCGWIMAFVLCGIIWYNVGYYMNRLYRLYHPDDSLQVPTYRTSVRLLEKH